MEKKDKNPGTHQPERFKEYTEAEDGSGFFLDDGTFFRFDKKGGWVDEFNNYYDKDGNPAPEPDGSDSELDSEGDNPEILDIEDALKGYQDDLIDEYEEGAMLPDDEEFEEVDEEEELQAFMYQEREGRSFLSSDRRQSQQTPGSKS